MEVSFNRVNTVFACVETKRNSSFYSKVSYVKGLDWYLMVSFTIIFLSLVECIVVDRLWRASHTNKSQKEKDIEGNTNRSKTSKVELYEIFMNEPVANTARAFVS